MVGLAGSLATHLLFHGPSAQALQTPMPHAVRAFTAKKRTSYFSRAGTMSVQVLSTYHRFSDGGTVTEQRQTYPEKLDLNGEIFDMQLERKILREPVTKSMITMRFPRQDHVRFLLGLLEENCPGQEEMSRATPGGEYLVYHTLRIGTELGSDWMERWVIPELQCFATKQIFLAGGARTQTDVISLREGEPSRDLTRPPAGYTERSPAEWSEPIRPSPARLCLATFRPSASKPNIGPETQNSAPARRLLRCRPPGAGAAEGRRRSARRGRVVGPAQVLGTVPGTGRAANFSSPALRCSRRRG